MILNNWKIRIHNLLLTGHEIYDVPNVMGHQNTDDAIHLIRHAARKDPDYLLSEIFMSSFFSMTIPSIAILLSNAPKEFIDNVENKNILHEILIEKEPPQLLELTEYLKSKVFGRGLGSRSQKLIKRIMESWQIETLEHYIEQYPKVMTDLVYIIHPRYRGIRGKLIKSLFVNYKK